ncbi:hypothetical protein LINGRAHAP2_LOCUS1936, partial [Linum grandiflorum]
LPPPIPILIVVSFSSAVFTFQISLPLAVSCPKLPAPPTSNPPILHPQIYPSPASAPSPIQTLNPSAMDGSKSENPKSADVNQASDSSSFSLSSGKKARITIEVVAAVCAVGFRGLICHKKQQNVRRPQHGYSGSGIELCRRRLLPSL